MWIKGFKEWFQNLFMQARRFFPALIGRKPASPMTTSGSNEYFYPTRKMVLEALPVLFSELESHGYAKRDYERNRKDCNVYSRKQEATLYDILHEQTEGIAEAQGKELAVFGYSFLRDNRKRHRVAMVVTDEQEKMYVETYRIIDGQHSADGMLRILSAFEEDNGVVRG